MAVENRISHAKKEGSDIGGLISAIAPLLPLVVQGISWWDARRREEREDIRREVLDARSQEREWAASRLQQQALDHAQSQERMTAFFRALQGIGTDEAADDSESSGESTQQIIEKAISTVATVAQVMIG